MKMTNGDGNVVYMRVFDSDAPGLEKYAAYK